MSKIIVKSLTDGFRRAGIEFNKTGVTLDTGELTKVQLGAIHSDPSLLVSEVASKPSKPETAAERKAREEAEAAEKKAAADAAANTDQGNGK